jgi:anti-sigma regulatory factor (Ser/Thr protein kinase)
VTTERVERSFPMSADSIDDIRGFVREHAAAAGFDQRVSEDLAVAVWEACSHAYRRSGRSGPVQVSWLANEHSVEVVVRSEGVYTGQGGPEESLETSLTMAMEMALVDQVHVRPGTEEEPTTEIRLVKFIGR